MKEPPVVCPRCSVVTEKQEQGRLFKLVIDVCPKCKGMWFDHGELSKVAKTHDIENFLDNLEGFDRESQISCPRCAGKMDIERVDDVEVDVCLNCQGIWLDTGEFEHLNMHPKKQDIVNCFIENGRLPVYEDGEDGFRKEDAGRRAVRDFVITAKYAPPQYRTNLE